MKKIVIMLSTYNGSKFLKYQLDSINNQDVNNLEIEIVARDDGSVDNTVQILNRQFDNVMIHIIKDKRKLGACDSFLELILNAPAADYYAFVDQDDLWDRNKLSVAIEEIDQNADGKPMLWASNCRIINEHNTILQNSLQKSDPVFSIPSQLICGSLQGCSMVFNKELFTILKNCRFNYTPMHDILVTMLAICYGKIIYSMEPLFSYRMHADNVVAKNGKSLKTRIKQSMVLWFGEKNKYSISRFASEILNHCSNLNKDDEEYLRNIIECRRSMRARLKIINNSRTISNNKRALISFKIRVIIGII